VLWPVPLRLICYGETVTAGFHVDGLGGRACVNVGIHLPGTCADAVTVSSSAERRLRDTVVERLSGSGI
jgi:hypothetical protein